MPEEGNRFRDRLLQAEPTTPAYREKHEKEIRAMFEKKLSTVERWSYFGMAASGIIAGIYVATMALRQAPPYFLSIPPVIWGLIAAFLFVKAVLLAWVGVKGTWNPRTDPTRVVALHWFAAVLVVTLMITWWAGDLESNTAVFGAICAGLILAAIAVSAIFNRVDQAELKTREKLLEIELRLAELAERVGKSD